MPASFIERASGLQDALDASPYLFRRHEVAAVGRRDAAFYRLGETRIVVEKARDGLLSEFIDVASVTRRERGKPASCSGERRISMLWKLASLLEVSRASMISMR
jgi:hypothetical protein